MSSRWLPEFFSAGLDLVTDLAQGYWQLEWGG